MGMYGALIADPKNKTYCPPATEVVLVICEFNIKNPLAFLAYYHLIMDIQISISIILLNQIKTMKVDFKS